MKTFHSYSFGAWWAAQLKWLDEDEIPWREVRGPGSDISDLPQEVQDEINDKWTDALINSYQLWLADPQEGNVPGPKTPTPKQVRLAEEAKAALAVKVEDAEVVEGIPLPSPKPQPKLKTKK